MRNIMKRIWFIGMLSVVLTGCVTAKKFSTFIDTESRIETPKNESGKDWLIITAGTSEPDQTRCEQKKNSFVPALLYWSWNSTFECEIGMQTRMKYLEKGIFKAADSLNLQSYLDGKKLLIRVKEVPGKFLSENKGNVVIFLVAYAMSGVEGISPYPQNLQFEYAVIDNGKTGTETEGFIQHTGQPVENLWKTTKKFIRSYMDDYKKKSSDWVANWFKT